MTVTPAGRIEVSAPSATRYGLFTASPPETLLDRNIGGGNVYDTDWCGQADLVQSQCVASAAKVFDEGGNIVEASAFAVYAAIVCGPVGYDSAEFADKARQKLTSGEQGAVELGLWTGLVGVGGAALGIDGFNNSLPTTVTVVDSDSIVSIVSALEAFAYLTSGYGHPAFIHAPVSVAAYAAEANLIVERGGLLTTPYGSIWVFGGGYPGTDDGGTVPAGGTAIYVTGQVHVWRATNVNVPDVPQTLDRTANQQYVLAEREYAASWDCLLGEAIFTFPLGGS